MGEPLKINYRSHQFPIGLTDSQSYVPIVVNDANHWVGIHSAVNSKNGDMIGYQLTLVGIPALAGDIKIT